MAIYFHFATVPVIQVFYQSLVIVVKEVVMAGLYIDQCFRPLIDFYHVCVCVLYTTYMSKQQHNKIHTQENTSIRKKV